VRRLGLAVRTGQVGLPPWIRTSNATELIMLADSSAVDHVWLGLAALRATLVLILERIQASREPMLRHEPVGHDLAALQVRGRTRCNGSSTSFSFDGWGKPGDGDRARHAHTGATARHSTGIAHGRLAWRHSCRHITGREAGTSPGRPRRPAWRQRSEIRIVPSYARYRDIPMQVSRGRGFTASPGWGRWRVDRAFPRHWSSYSASTSRQTSFIKWGRTGRRSSKPHASLGLRFARFPYHGIELSRHRFKFKLKNQNKTNHFNGTSSWIEREHPDARL
jgi:hypothetical protein